VEIEMRNITLAIDEELLKRARALAAERHTTLNALVRSLLAHEVEQNDRIALARRGMRELMERSTLDMGPDYRWNRDDAYAEREDRLLSRHQHPDLRGSGKDAG
jgi:hypothetical protein